MGFTKVGPPDRGDYVRKRGLLHRIGRFFYVGSGLAWFLSAAWFMSPRTSKKAFDVLTSDPDAPAHYHPPEGIPEADLTEEERKLALEQMRWREDSIKKE